MSFEADTSLTSVSDKLVLALGHAVLAPSSHNTQPWLFRMTPQSIELYLDHTKALPVADPENRELTISCGAALHHLQVALDHFGIGHKTELLPSSAQQDFLARVSVTETSDFQSAGSPLFGTIGQRHTNRKEFEARDLPQGLVEAMYAATRERDDVSLNVVEANQRTMVADLVTEGNVRQWGDARFRKELASWMHPNRSTRRDGMRGYGFGFGDLSSIFSPLLVRVVNSGKRIAASDRSLINEAPFVAVLASIKDDRKSWLQTGMALSAILLVAAAQGVDASFFNQPTQVQELRTRLREELYLSAHPQITFRMGYGPQTKAQPRRPVEEVVFEGNPP